MIGGQKEILLRRRIDQRAGAKKRAGAALKIHPCHRAPAIGDGATELIHIGQTVMAYQGQIDYFVDAVFNYPTLAECYRVAALDGINQLPRPWTPRA